MSGCPDPLPDISGPLDLSRDDGRYVPAPRADQLNELARYCFAWSDFLRSSEDLSGMTKEVVTDAFESIGFHLGDGVAYDQQTTALLHEEGE